MDSLSSFDYAKLLQLKLKELEDVDKAQNSLHEFMKQAWHVVEGKHKFYDGWHIQAIAEHLEALYRRDIRYLIINVPPRSTKTTLISIMFPAWVWLNAPHERFLYASYANKISLKDSVNCRRLIQSPWYQARWGHQYKIEKDQNTKGRFNNDKTGYRISTSVGSSGTTGDGGDFLIIDDGNSSEDVKSIVKRERANDWLFGGFLVRQNNPETSAFLNVQQRFHTEDLSGTLMDSDSSNKYTKLILPMEFERERKCSTIILPSTNGKLWTDPRQEEKELLWPERFPLERVEEYKKDILKTAYNVAGQFQQRPAPAEGGYIKKSWFKLWKEEKYPKFIQTIQSWDTAFSSDKKSSYSACTTWGVFHGDHNIPNLMLIGMWRGHVLYPELRKIAQKLAADYRDEGTNEFFVANHNFQPNLILVESKASGQSLIPDLQRAGIMCVGFNPSKYGDKETRVERVTHIIEAGRIWVPAIAPNFKQIKPFADTFIEECALFPNASSTDLVDSMTQVLIRTMQANLLKNPTDAEDLPENNSPKFIY